MYIHTYVHTYTHTHVHTHIHTYIHTHIRTYIHTYIHTCTYIHTHIRTYIHTHIHAYIHTYVRTYIYTYIHTVQEAVLSINQAVDSGKLSNLLNSLQSEDVNLSEVIPKNLKWYSDILSKTKKHNTEVLHFFSELSSVFNPSITPSIPPRVIFPYLAFPSFLPVV